MTARKERHEWRIDIDYRNLSSTSAAMSRISRETDERYPTIPEEIYAEWKRLARPNYLPVRVSRTRFVMRKVEEITPLGCWRVVRFSYRGKKYKSLLNDIYGYASIDDAWTIVE